MEHETLKERQEANLLWLSQVGYDTSSNIMQFIARVLIKLS